MSQQDQGLVAAFGGSVLDIGNRLPFAGFSGDQELDVVLLESLDLFVWTPRRREAAQPG